MYQKRYILLMEKILTVYFYRNPKTKAEPVKEWLRSLPQEDRKQIGEDLQLVEYGWPIGMPVCRPLGDGLFEVRSNLRSRISRVIFFPTDGKMILLHAFLKTTQKTPKQDLALARQRKDLLGGE